MAQAVLEIAEVVPGDEHWGNEHIFHGIVPFDVGMHILYINKLGSGYLIEPCTVLGMNFLVIFPLVPVAGVLYSHCY